MRNKDLVKLKSKKYFLTNFGSILFNSIINLVEEIKKYEPETLFSECTWRDIAKSMLNRSKEIDGEII